MESSALNTVHCERILRLMATVVVETLSRKSLIRKKTRFKLSQYAYTSYY